MMEHSAALKIAEGLVCEFGPYCERVEIAGSIRRGKAEVGDIEIVAVPRFTAMYTERDGLPAQPAADGGGAVRQERAAL